MQQRKEKVEKVETTAPELKGFTTVGKIDLENVGKKPKATEKAKANVEETKAEKKEKATENAPKADSKKDKHQKDNPKETIKQPTVEAPKETKKEAEKPSEPTKIETVVPEVPALKVMGKIDLTSINQSTRPKKKSKEEKRKEREEKLHQEQAANAEKKKKRTRIAQGRVDINEAIRQSNNSGNGDMLNQDIMSQLRQKQKELNDAEQEKRAVEEEKKRQEICSLYTNTFNAGKLCYGLQQ